MSSFLRGRATGEATPCVSEPPAAGIRRITKGTDQQEALWAALLNGDSHVLAEARAGAGKSSSCREGMWRIIDKRFAGRMRYVVFNKANAEEFRQHCPPGVEVGTSHSFGFQAILRAYKWAKVDKNKTYSLLSSGKCVDKLSYNVRRSVAALVSHAKNQCLDPRTNYGELTTALEKLSFYYDVPTYRQTDVILDAAAAVLDVSLAQNEVIDFDDMLWLPAMLELPFPPCDLLFLDEVQDFNPTQQRLVPLMNSAGRIVLVGDRYQAINAFRGADVDSIPTLAAGLVVSQRALATLPLTITFRCPQSHVFLANRYVPDLQAAPDAPDGVVEYDMPLEKMLDELQPGHLVICPTNTPIISACLQMIRRRVPAYVRGRGLGEQLLNILRGIHAARTVEDMVYGVEDWRNEQLNRLANRDGSEDAQQEVTDRAAGLLAILDSCGSPADAPLLIAQLFGENKRADAITFSTIHRAKGDEADTVYLIDVPPPATTRAWQARQNVNMRYVALTRSKRRLVFVQPPKKLSAR